MNIKDRFDFVILSNVLEHLDNRIELLVRIRDVADILLFRVPMIDRSWLAVYTKRINLEYRLDKTHCIEYTLNSFINELSSAGLKIISHSIQFGEIWAVVGSIN